MKIPLEHFSNTPVYALSPMAAPVAPAPTPISDVGGRDYHSLAPTLAATPTSHAHSVRKHSFPEVKNSVGSAPNSPTAEKKFMMGGINTISGHFEERGGVEAGSVGSPRSAYEQQKAVMRNPSYATLPKKYVGSRDM